MRLIQMFKYYLLAAGISLVGVVVVVGVMVALTEWDEINRDKWRQ